MSLNSLIDRKYIHSVDGFKKILREYTNRLSIARTQEERLGVEVEAVTMFEDLLSFDRLIIDMVRPVDHLEVNDFNDPRRIFRNMILLNIVRTDSISQTYLTYVNNQRSDLLELYGKIRRIKQKKATLDLWAGGKSKYIISESFFNLDNISDRFINESPCSIDSVAGCLTLPVTGSRDVSPSRVVIGSKSNGIVGTEEINVNVNNRDPAFVFDGNQETYFQYEGSRGPLDLVLICELPKTEIINQIDIEPVNISDSVNFSVKDITFSSSEKEVTSLKKMVDGNVEDDYFTVKSSENDNYWSCKFLPVRCQQVIIHLQQNDSHKVQVYNPEDREVSQAKFSIGVRSISFKRNEYASIGGMGSAEISIPQGLYGAAVTSQIFPRTETLFEIYSDVSFDGGETWETDVYSLPEVDSKSLVMDGIADSALWRLRIERNDDAFEEARSLTDDEVEFEIETKQRNVSRFVSPIRFSIPERPYNKQVKVIQPKIARKTKQRRDAIRLGTGSKSSIKRISLGYSLVDINLDPEDMHVYVNGIEWVRVDDSGPDELNPSALEGEFHLSPGQDAIIFGDSLPENAIITYRFDEERVLWEEASDGYYAVLDAPFDPDAMNIRISGRPLNPKRMSRIVPRGMKRINLGKKDIKGIEFISDGSLTFTEQASIYEVNAGSPAASEIFYYIDTQNGLLHLNPAIDDATNIKMSFEHAAAVPIEQSKIKVVTDGIEPIGIRVEKDSLLLTEHRDASGNERGEKFNPKTRVFGQRLVDFSVDPLPGGKATILTHDYIVKGTVSVDSSILSGYSAKDFPMVEVDFIDGISEFLGLIQMDNEKTIAIKAGSDGIVVFSLAARGSVYKDFGVTFDDASVFDPAKEQASLSSLQTLGPTEIGAYYIDYDEGLVYVTVGAGETLKEDVSILYSYYDVNFNSENLFSVDYKDGVLYTSRNQSISTKKNIRYKTSQHTISYDIAREVDSYSYDVAKNVVSVRTEGLSQINNLVKVVWAQALIKPSLGGLRKYFSPILNSFGIRFQ